MGRAAVLVFLLLAAATALAVESSAKGRAQQVLERRSYQTELPGDPAHGRTLRLGSLDPSLTWLIGGVGYVALFVAVGAFLFALVRRINHDRTPGPVATRTAAVPTEPRAAPTGAAGGPNLADADRLAGAGDHRAAVHALLLVAIGECALLTRSSFPLSATARELARLLPLDAAREAGFGALVRVVERSLFGGRDVGADEYAACRAHCLLLSGRHVA